MKNVYGCLLLLFCLLSDATGANGSTVDTLKNLKEEALINYSFRFFNTEIQYADSATAFRTLGHMEQIAGDRNSCALQMCVTFLKGKYCIIQDARNKFKIISCLPFLDSVLAQKQCSEILHTEAMFFKGYVLSKTPTIPGL